MSPFARLNAGARHFGPRFFTVWSFAAGIFFLAVSTSFIGCGDDGNPTPIVSRPADFLPHGTEAMQQEGTPRTATDNAGLRDIVDEGFEYYATNGFLEMVEQMYSGTVGGTSATARVWIFDMGTAENTASLHEQLLQEGSWEDWAVLGDEDHRRSTELGFTILFRRDNYSAQLDINLSSQDARDLLALFANHIDQAILGQ